MKELKVAGVGCSLADFLYTGVDFSGAGFSKYLSESDGDGGLVPGQLVFAEDLEQFAGVPFSTILRDIVGDGKPDAFNLGGPAIVGMINAAQLLYGKKAEFDFYGALGHDETAEKILSIVKQTPVNYDNYIKVSGNSPFTDVFSDPNHHNGKGERTFVNSVGAVLEYGPDKLGDDFFNADILFFGATALVPQIHDNLTALLKRGREAGKVNMVTTVFDFRNEKKHKGCKWPLGESDDSYKYIDLLVVDWDEAMKLSGEKDIYAAIDFFISHGVSAFVITHGAHDFYAWSDGRLFKKREIIALPINRLVDEEMEADPSLRGDTTGCGDNFAGGILASLCDQLTEREPGTLDIVEACSWGAASGGFACFCIGGTYLEKHPGEKASRVVKYQKAYMEQIADLLK